MDPERLLTKDEVEYRLEATLSDVSEDIDGLAVGVVVSDDIVPLPVTAAALEANIVVPL